MAFKITTFIACDGANCRRETIGTTANGVAKMDETVRMQRLGWKITPERHLCPDCQQIKSPKPPADQSPG
jgi:hypothetical protein